MNLVLSSIVSCLIVLIICLSLLLSSVTPTLRELPIPPSYCPLLYLSRQLQRMYINPDELLLQQLEYLVSLISCST
jgi:hypothetical protein